MESVYAALMSDFYSLAPLKQELLFKVSLGSFFTYSYAYLLFCTKSGRKTICNTYVQKIICVLWVGILHIRSLRTGQSFEFGTYTYNITIPSGWAIRNCLYLSKAGALAKIESEHLDLWGVHLPTLNVAAIYRVK